MKKIFIICLTASLILCSCQDKKLIYGRHTLGDIYIVENGEIIDAHGFNVEFSKAGGSVSWMIVGPSDKIYTSQNKKTDWISVEVEGGPEIFDFGNDGRFLEGTWYSQKIVLEVLPNDSGKDRICGLDFKSWSSNDTKVALLAIKQTGK